MGEPLGYTYVNETYHYVSQNYSGKKWSCPDCGESGTDETPGRYDYRLEEHEYGEGSTCVKCDGELPCTHPEKTMEYNYSAEPTYEQIEGDLEHHVRIRNYSSYTWTCSICGETGTVYEPGTERDETAPHSEPGSDGRCPDCGMCLHRARERKDLSALDEAIFRQIEDDDLYHIAVAPLVYREVCSNCGEVLKEEWGESQGVEEIRQPHTFDENNVCTACGYATECRHADRTSPEYIYDSVAYNSLNAEEHEYRWTASKQRWTCNTCGKTVIEDIEKTGASQNEPHAFDGGVCAQCGYRHGECARGEHRAKCSAPGVCYVCGRSVACENIDHSYEGYESDGENHWQQCRLCRQESARAAHSYKNGKCVVCGARQPGGVVKVQSITLSAPRLMPVKGESILLTAQIEPADADNPELKWTSDNQGVAMVEVSEGGARVSAVGIGTAKIRCEAADGGGAFAECAVTVSGRSIRKIAPSEASLALEVGKSAALTATLTPQEADEGIVWSSDDKSIARVESTPEGCEVIAVAPGETNVRCRAGGNERIFALCKVTVSAVGVSKITLNQTALGMSVGESKLLTADVAPESAFDRSLIWLSSAPRVARVRNGRVTAFDEGKATIRCVAADNSGVYAECEVTVVGRKVDQVELSMYKLTLLKGEVATLTAEALPEFALNRDLKWSSDDESVATVENGTIIAVEGGETVIRCEAVDGGGACAECALTVTLKASKKGFSLNKTKITLGENGDRFQLSVKKYKSKGCGSNVSYSSSDKSVATVDPQSGWVTAGAKGKATITAQTANGKKAKCKVTVKTAPSTVTISQKELTLSEGMEAKLSATYTKKTVCSYRFISGDPQVVAVDAQGKVAAVGAGETEITVRAHNGITDVCAVRVLPAPTRIALEKSITLGKGEKYELRPSAPGSVASYTAVSGDAKTLSVKAAKESGVFAIQAKKTGSAEITVRTHNGVEARTTVTIQKAPSKVTLSEKKRTLGVGDEIELVATLPEGSASKLTATASGKGIVTVKELAPGRYSIKAEKKGSSTIAVKSFNKKKATCKITVKEAPASAKLSRETAELGAGETAELSVAFEPAASWADVIWKSSDEGVVEVSGGKLTAKAEGSARITAKVLNQPEMACQVTVKAAPAEGNAKLEPQNPTVQVKGTQQMSVAYTNAAGAVKSWKSSKSTVASVSKTGLVTGKKAGTATITATLYNGVEIATTVTVVK